MNEKQISFEEAKKIRLEIMKEIDKFCNENNITYYLSFGTLIGAVRHGGFIPWDDDMDIIMSRPDLEKFIKDYPENSKYELVTNFDSKGFFYGFAKLVRKNTYYMCGKFSLPGVNVEIYPIDGCPSSKKEFAKFKTKIDRIVYFENLFIRIIFGLMRRRLWPFKKPSISLMDTFCRKYHSFASKYPYEKSDMVSFLFGYKYEKKQFPKIYFEEGIKMKFEDTDFMVPRKYHDFLTSIYGDYMKLPSVDKQKPDHGIIYYWI